MKGVALDLRYAVGDDYAAAAAAADLFVKKELPLLNWGNGMVRSKEKTNAIALPVAVLVNRQTAGAAEALAAAVQGQPALIIVGDVMAARREGLKAKSLLYDDGFTHGFREGHVA